MAEKTIDAKLNRLVRLHLTSLRSEAGTATQRSGEAKRDGLFFTLLGIPGYEEKPQNQLKVSP